MEFTFIIYLNVDLEQWEEQETIVQDSSRVVVVGIVLAESYRGSGRF